jgi:RNA polymerase sigma factor (sigma-70 family)
MSTDNPTFDPQELLSHKGWLQRLAARLVDAPGSADDLVQDAWVVALRSPPSAERPPRPWLAQVLRNLVKNRRRSAGRWAARVPQVAAAEDAPLPTAEELLTQHEAQRLMASLVSELGEPYRSTVLLCYAQGLAPTEVARRQGLPAGTVRWRLKRGLDELRERLDARYGNDRRAWRAALAPLAAQALRAGGAAPLVGAMKVVAAMAVTAALGLWLGRAIPEAHRARLAVQGGVTDRLAAPAAAGAPTRAAPRAAAGVPAPDPGMGAPAGPPPSPAAALAAGLPAGGGAGSEALRRAMEPGKSPRRGPAEAPVTIVVFSEFQCPFCQRVQSTLDELLAAYPKDVRLVFRNLPLAFHENAPLAAEAALAAHEQGKFWQMHDRLFANQSALDPASLEVHAAAIGLDVARFRKALEDKRFLPAVQEDMRLARELDINGTPAFLVNGKRVMGAQPLGAFKQAVDEALARAAGRPVPEAPAPEGPPRPTPEALQRAAQPGSAPARGEASAAVTIVMFGEFECPFCARVQATLAEVLAAYPRDVRLVWKNLPLPMHEHAALAAEAALAADEQGKFWPMHDRLMQNQAHLDAADLDGHAQAVGLDLARFRKALEDHRFRKIVEQDLRAARDAGLNGTPSFLVNGRPLTGARPLPDFKRAVDRELARARGLPVTEEPLFVAPTVRPPGRPPGSRFDVGRALDWPPPRVALPDELLGEPLRAPFPIADAPTLGPARAPVELVYLNDYDCEGCGRGKTLIDGVRRAYGDTVRVVARPVPIPNNGNGALVAEAAWAAHAQGKFWPMYEKIFGQQATRDRPTLERYAQEIGLDVDDFRAALDAGRYRGKVGEDVELVRQLGLGSRPIYIVNGRRAEGPVGVMMLIEAALKKAGLTPPVLPPPPMVGLRGPDGVRPPDFSPLSFFLTEPQRFHVEPRDEAGAAPLEGALASRLERDLRAADPASAGARLECRTTLCRLRYRAGKDRGAGRAFLRQFYAAQSLAVGPEEHAYFKVREPREAPEATLARMTSRRSALLFSLRTGRLKPEPELRLDRLPAER